MPYYRLGTYHKDMRATRGAPMLLIGFGLLIGLIGLTGVGALRRAGGAYRDISALNERYVRTERELNAVRGGIYVVGVLARDYLLDPSNVHAADYRAQLITERKSMEEEMRQLEGAVQHENRLELDRLRKEVEGYWDALDPLFTWTPEEKAARSWGFLTARGSAAAGSGVICCA